MKAARAGAKIAIGLDISSVSVHNAKESAVSEGLTLHHLDLAYAFPELKRI